MVIESIEELGELITLMHEEGAAYVRIGDVEVTLGARPVEAPKDEPAKFVHDTPEPDAPKRHNRLLDHPSLRR